MKTIICLLTFLSFSTFAEEYKAPKVQRLHWEKVDKKTPQPKANPWVSDYQLKETGTVENGDNPERKPSSGDETKKPKYWDFQVVK
ncbi:MAG: hypothetical protein BM556_07240 [Bacteriovorax sp. MedPE-SWde]|nr:MAG: hypothetical protein BM556_07240 [Bacteriovorax sp. MedPE-SWde]